MGKRGAAVMGMIEKKDESEAVPSGPGSDPAERGSSRSVGGAGLHGGIVGPPQRSGPPGGSPGDAAHDIMRNVEQVRGSGTRRPAPPPGAGSGGAEKFLLERMWLEGAARRTLHLKGEDDIIVQWLFDLSRVPKTLGDVVMEHEDLEAIYLMALDSGSTREVAVKSVMTARSIAMPKRLLAQHLRQVGLEFHKEGMERIVHKHGLTPQDHTMLSMMRRMEDRMDRDTEDAIRREQTAWLLDNEDSEGDATD